MHKHWPHRPSYDIIEPGSSCFDVVRVVTCADHIMAPRNKKRKATDEPDISKKPQSAKIQSKKKSAKWTPASIQADPQLYLRSLPETLQSEPKFALAALLGLTTTLSTGPRSDEQTNDIISNVSQHCPNVLANASRFRQFVTSGGDNTTKLLRCSKLLPLMAKASWGLDLARLAVRKVPLFYKHLPLSLKSDAQLALDALLRNNDVAVEYVGLRTIVEEMHACCSNLFSTPRAMQKLLHCGNETLIMTVLTSFSNQILWDPKLVDLALDLCPLSLFILPPHVRIDDTFQGRHVLMAMLKLEVGNGCSREEMIARVDGVISKYPYLFTEQDTLKYLFQRANKAVVCRILERMSNRLPWDKSLTRLAAKHCRSSMVGTEIERIFEGKSDCKHHLPLGMLLSPFFAKTVDVWPDFLNNCRCALSHDDAVLLAALHFLDPMLLRSRLSVEFKSWLLGVVCPIRLKLQSKLAFQTLLKCITVADGQGPLELFPKDTDTSKALTRKIAEFLGAPIEATEMKQDAVKLVHCLLTLPREFVNDFIDRADMLLYHSLCRRELFFSHCDWCCDVLVTLDKKYYNEEDDKEEDQEGSSVDGTSECEDDNDDEYSGLLVHYHGDMF